jgi:hypothetical protein
MYHLREETPLQSAQTFGYAVIDRSEILPSLEAV